MKLKPILALDLDGTVKVTLSGEPFAKNAHDVKLVEGIEEAIWKWKNLGYIIFGISNQGGVAMKFKTPEEAVEEVEYMKSLFNKDPFNAYKLCFAMKGAKDPDFDFRSLIRKPHYGMLVQAEQELYELGIMVDWDKSLMVGDRLEDEQCASKAEIAFMYINPFLEYTKKM